MPRPATPRRRKSQTAPKNNVTASDNDNLGGSLSVFTKSILYRVDHLIRACVACRRSGVIVSPKVEAHTISKVLSNLAAHSESPSRVLPKSPDSCICCRSPTNYNVDARPHFVLVVVRRHWHLGAVQIRNMRELAAAVRAERKRLGLSQSDLAEMAGVGRDWIIGLEKGKPTAEIGLILRTLRSLGLTVQFGSTSEVHPPSRINLNDLLDNHPE